MIDPQNDLTENQVPQPSSMPTASQNQDPSAHHVVASPERPTLPFAEPPAASALAPATPSQPDPSPHDPSATTALLSIPFAAASLPSLQTRPAPKPRNGKIAHLPKPEREMVNRMLANNLPQEKIVDALDDRGFRVTQRNISNWKTRGGYREWRAAQERALELRTFQDNLTGFLRRHDAADLPEVGLQAAATALSAIFLRPDLIRELISDPQKYSKLIEIQCRLAREIQARQKERDATSRSFGPNSDPERLKRENEAHVEGIREIYSSKIGESPRDPDIPHRNFIPQELDPAPETRQPLDWTQTLKLFSSLAKPQPATSPSPKTAPPGSGTN
jgi:hypothetical protein